jgi:hypothetical protein
MFDSGKLAASQLAPAFLWRSRSFCYSIILQAVMSEIQRIIDQLQRAFDGDAWSGPSLEATLQNLSAAQAATKV